MKHIADPVISNFDVFQTFVHCIIKVDQSYGTLIVNMKVDRFIANEPKFIEQGVEPRCGFHSMDSQNVFSLSCQEQNRCLFLQAPCETAAVEHECKARNRFSHVRVIHKVGIAVCSDF